MKASVVSFIYFILFLSTSIQAQQFVVKHHGSGEPIEFVSAVLLSNAKPLEMVRSNYKGEVFFSKFDQSWDTVMFFRLGMKSVNFSKSNYSKEILLFPNPKQIDEVVITGQIVPGNKYQSPFKMKFFTAEEIKNKNSFSLADFLQSENNFTVTQDPILGSKVSINGMSGADLKLMIDGIPVAGRLNGNIDYSQVLLNNIERIEVVDGPLSTIYGTNATGGVINLITKTGTLYESSITANAYLESVGVANLNVYYNTTRKGHRVSLGIHRNVFLGWDPNSDSLSKTVKPIWRDESWNPKEQVMVNTSYYAPLSKKTNLHFKLNGFWETVYNKLNPSSVMQYNVIDEYYNTRKLNLGTNFNSILSKQLDWQNYANLNYFSRITEYYSQDLIKGDQDFLQAINEDIINVFGRTQMKHELKNQQTKLLYGLDYNMDIGRSTKLDSQVKSVRDLGMFIMCNAKIGKKMLVQPGLRYSINSILNVPLSGTANIRYELSKHFSSRISFSRGYRIPELKELYFRFVDINHNIQGNQNLKTELNDNIQLGIDVIPVKEKAKDRLISYSSSLNISYFNKKDAIELVNIDKNKNEFQYLNVGNFKGLVWNIDNRVKYKDYILVFGTSVLGYSRRFDSSINQIEDWIYNWTMNLNFTYNVKKWDMKMTTINKFNSANNFIVYNLQSDLVEKSRIPAYVYSDFNVSKPLFKNKINLTLGVKNIFDIKNLQLTGFSGNVHQASNANEVNQLWGRTFFTNIVLNIDNLK